MSKGPPTHALRQLRVLLDGGTTAGLSDAQLLQRYNDRRGAATRAAAEAEVAFAALVDRHGPMVWGACHRSLGDLHEAEDAFQATFLILARRAGAVRVDDSLGRWLYGVARRVAARARADRLRRRAKEAQVRAGEPPERLDPNAGPEELRAAVAEELGRLPDRYRRPVVLCLLDGLTYAGAAERLGWPAGTVKSRLARARNLLRARLARRGLAPGSTLMGSWLAPESQAAVPAALVERTVRSASILARSSGAVVSTPVLTLADGVIRTMMVLRMTRVLAGLTLTSIGIGWIAGRPHAPEAAIAVGAFQAPNAQGQDARIDDRGDSASAIAAPLPRPEVLHRLLRRAADEASLIARNDPQPSSFTLVTLATALARSGDPVGARETFRVAIQEAGGEFGGKPRPANLAGIAHSQIEAGLTEDAIRTLQRALEAVPDATGDSSDDHWTVLALRSVVEGQARLGRRDQARQTAERLKSFAGEAVRKSKASNADAFLAPNVAAAMAAAGAFEAAFERAGAVPRTDLVLEAAALSAARYLDRKTASRFVEEAVARTNAIDPARTAYHGSGDLAEALARIGDLKAAKRLARSIGEGSRRAVTGMTILNRVQALRSIARKASRATWAVRRRPCVRRTG